MIAIQMGVARGIFSNEAGLGSAPIAHAAAETDNPVRQGTVADARNLYRYHHHLHHHWPGHRCVRSLDLGREWCQPVCACLRQRIARHRCLCGRPWPGGICVHHRSGWSVYGERCVEYLFGVSAIIPFRVLWVLAVPLGALVKLDFVWLVADTLNAMMAIPNLIALLLLSPVVFQVTREYFASQAD